MEAEAWWSSRAAVRRGRPQGMSASSDRRYNLILGVSVRKSLNNVNRGESERNSGLAIFRHSQRAAGGTFSTGAANRRLDLQATFSF